MGYSDCRSRQAAFEQWTQKNCTSPIVKSAEVTTLELVNPPMEVIAAVAALAASATAEMAEAASAVVASHPPNDEDAMVMMMLP